MATNSALINYTCGPDQSNANKYVMNLVITLPDCCAICCKPCNELEFKLSVPILQKCCTSSARGDVPWFRAHFVFDNSQHSNKKDFSDLLDKIRRDGFNYDRYCDNCIEKTLRFHASKGDSFVRGDSEEEIVITCPFCKNQPGNLKTEILLNSFKENEELLKYLKNRLERIWTYRNYDIRYCPIIGCPHKQYFGKNRPDCSLKERATQFVDCPTHGRQCVLCWKVTRPEIKHICSGVPLPILDIREDKSRLGVVVMNTDRFDTNEPNNEEIGRCPQCLSVITKDGGCNKMQCRCGNEFQWNMNIIKKKSWIDDEVANKEAINRAKLQAENQAKIEKVERYMLMTRVL